jgi:nicotinamide-nucleotide amidase
MVRGALAASRADVAIAVTGVAGPGGGTPEKPEGLVHLAAGRRDGDIIARECQFGPIGRGQVRLKTIETALVMLREAMD